MKKVLIIFATREGQTEKVATRISEHLTSSGADVLLANAKDKHATDSIDLCAYDLLVFGASMHVGGLESELVEFINANREKIELRDRAFFMVLLSAATKDPALKDASLADARKKMVEQVLIPFDDVEMIAGALKYSKYPLALKWVMRRIARKSGEDTDMSKDYEYTDWRQVERYATRLYEMSS